MKPAIFSHPLSFKGMAITTAVVAGLSLGEAKAKSADLDGDGIANLLDPDVDGDGIPNGRDLNVDGGVCRRGPFKGKYVGDHLLNGNPNEKDIDADGFKDNSPAELDIDGDGKKDDSAKEKDIDGDGRTDVVDPDIDGDGLGNGDLNEDDMDGDGISDHLDDDCDGDGKDRDHDDDDDADGISDGISDDSDGDDDGNWVPDNFEVDAGSSLGGSGTITIGAMYTEVSSRSDTGSGHAYLLTLVLQSGQTMNFRSPLEAVKMLETLSDADKQRFQLVVTNREDAMQPLNVDSLIARLLTDSDDSPVGIRVWTPVTDEIPAVDETLLAPGTSPTGEASIGMLTLSDSASSSAYVVSFSTGSPLDTVAWLESFSETNRGLDPLISDSRWGIDSPEDPTAAGRSRRTPDPTRETPAENPQVAADETVPVP